MDVGFGCVARFACVGLVCASSQVWTPVRDNCSGERVDVDTSIAVLPNRISLFLMPLCALNRYAERPSLFYRSALFNPLAVFRFRNERTERTHCASNGFYCQFIHYEFYARIRICSATTFTHTHTLARRLWLASSIYHWIYVGSVSLCAFDSSFILHFQTHTQTSRCDTSQARGGPMASMVCDSCTPSFASTRGRDCAMCVCVLCTFRWRISMRCMALRHLPCSNHMLASFWTDVMLCMNRFTLIGCRPIPTQNTLRGVCLLRASSHRWRRRNVIPTLFNAIRCVLCCCMCVPYECTCSQNSFW